MSAVASILSPFACPPNPLARIRIIKNERRKQMPKEIEKENTTFNEIVRLNQKQVSVDAFLKYRNIREFEEVESDENEAKNVCQEWDYTPSYYKALLYNRSLFNDEYIKGKVKRDIKTIIRKACMGKISVKGNYQTLAPDIYGLAQYAFGGKVTGLIGKNEIYSNYWWNGQFNKFYNDKRQVWYAAVGEVDLLRNPHIANEHCPVKVVSNQEMAKWYKYQTVNILTGFKDTNVMKLNGADFDGDHVLTVNNSIIIEAAKANVANTIVLNKKVISDVGENNAGSDNKKKKSGECKISDVKMLIKTDKIGFQNNIGNVVNRISLLWSLEQTPEVQEFIKIMSIIGSLTIDFVKTGIKVDIPKNIKRPITVGKHKKPYFMQYGSGAELRKSKTIKRETERLGMLKLISAQKEKYDNTDCVMNKICHHMENQLLNLRVEDTNKVFDYTTLLTSEVNPYNEAYKSLKVKLLDLQKEFTEICKKYSNLDEDEQKDFGQRQYQRFYSYCKVELQSTYYDKMRSVDNHKIVDCLIYMFYFDKDVMAKCADKSILWNTFTSEMLQRSKENIKPSRCDCFKLNERRDKSIKAVAKLKENSRKIGATYFDNAPKSTFTKDDKKELKKKIKDEDARNILFVLIILSRKLQPKEPIEVVRSGKNKINRSRICKLAGVDVRNYEKAIKQLMDKGLIITDCSDVLKQKYYVNFDMNDGESCAEIESVNNCIQAVNNNFNYLKKA